MTLLFLGAIACVVAFALTPVVRTISLRLGLLDVPNQRSSHVVPTPRSGGVAIVIGLIAAAVLSGVVQDANLRNVLYATVIVAAFSFIDDLKHLPSLLRFVLQIAAAVFAVIAGSLVQTSIDFPFRSWPLVFAFGFFVAVFWLVGLTNANNFMDGINGIAALQAAIAGTALSLLLGRAGDASASALAAIVAGAVLGFLPWNFPRGWIFMGDVGSASTGFLLAALILRESRFDGIIAATLPVFPFLFDTSVTLVRRAIRREQFLSAHRSHFYQRMTRLTESHTKVSLVWAALAAVSSIGSFVYVGAENVIKVIVLVVIAALHVAVALWITSAERARERSASS